MQAFPFWEATFFQGDFLSANSPFLPHSTPFHSSMETDKEEVPNKHQSSQYNGKHAGSTCTCLSFGSFGN